MTDSIERLSSALADRYRIERELGQGGMATVYLARDLKHDRRVAIKVLRPELAATLGPERFLREITTTANLRHPHILPLHDSGAADTFLYYVMPYVEGETLRERLDREKQLPLDEVRRITGEVADALTYAHGRGVIHRDIKPENIMLEGAHAVVADFGLARALTTASAQSLTQTGMAVGTPAYMSPEQAMGEQDLDGRSDQYALGCVTYEMLVGQPPFMGPTAQSVVHQHLAAAPRLVTQLRAAVPAGAAAALQRALAKNPADRFPTPSDFATALRSDARPGARRIPRRAAFAAFAVLALVAAGLAWRALRGSPGAGLDQDVIAVMPFRVGGTDPAIAYLRESMLDLLQARLSGATGPRTVEPRTLLAAWRRAVGNESNDLSEDASRRLARGLGAGRVLLGSAVATPTELTLSGTLLGVGDGAVLARESVNGAPDSIAVLVNRLTAALLIREAGESAERSAGLASAPLDALQDYLAGRKASRRGDYFGALQLFGRAFARDSTFVDAASAMVSTNAFIGTVFVTTGFEVVPQVSRLRDRLSARDLGLFLAMPMVGPNYPRPSTSAEIIAHAERAANAAPDSPEHWLLLGQLLSLYGAAASQTDWPARAAEALDRAIALDSSFALAISYRIFVAIQAGDREATARYTRLFEPRVASGFADDFILWAAARSLGDSATALKWRNRTEGLSHTDIMQKLIRMSLHSADFALPLGDARWAVETLAREATTSREHGGAVLADLAVRFAEGRASPTDLRPGEVWGPGWATSLIQQGVIDPAFRGMAGAAVAAEAAGAYRLGGTGTTRWPPVQLCYGEVYRVTGGDTTGTADAVRQLRAFAATEHPPVPRDDWIHLDFRICPLLLDVLRERPPEGGRPWPHLEALDSLMRGGPSWFGGQVGTSPTPLANLTIARLREAQGNIPAALAAIRRREVDYFPAYLWSLPAFLRQEGRLAALAGDTAGAVRAYDQYLTLRTNPDPPSRPQRDSVIAERAALASSQRR
jgi:tRNA A-37 threonylcarbamoyl transferase component Bud32/tetratricopeptide (TPR) repeat protein